MELTKINTTNYYISIPFIEGCFIDLKANDNFTIVLNKSGFTQLILFWNFSSTYTNKY